jgi:hypothetical protein
LDRLYLRSAAISCAFASCALVGASGFASIATAHADFFGIDFFGHHDKSDMHHPRPGSQAGAESTRSAAGIAAAEAPTAKIGSAPETAAAPESAATRSLASVPEAIVTATGGGGGLPRANTAGRPGNLARVSSAPSTRSVIIRRTPASVADTTPAPLRSPAVALAAPPPELQEPEALPAPEGPPAPAPTAPRVLAPLAPGDAPTARMPDSYRVGYAEYLRTADTSDLIVAALPGAAGIAGFTLVGAYAGYRQARAVQKALLAPAPTSILL